MAAGPQLEEAMVRFTWRVCECRFNNPSANDMHLMGRQHPLYFKKKVSLGRPVGIKGSTEPGIGRRRS